MGFGPSQGRVQPKQEVGKGILWFSGMILDMSGREG